MNIWFRRKQSYSISKYSKEFNNAGEISELMKELEIIEQKIQYLTQELLKAQAVGIKSALFPSNNWIDGLKRNIYGNAANESIKWHKERLETLYLDRKVTVRMLERKTGTFWKNRIGRWCKYVIIVAITIFVVWILFIGFMTALYLLPIWGTMVLLYFFLKKYMYSK